ncbi:AfsR/SARP family transcriptional regulator [Actinophytocola oryzae]|uniref:Putative ATPase n=1 Tax=Actinophytocola oryzae TaxID=502181 RepID=A0A4V3FUQ3_9PSEU|nr:NB-ARC domain-containing protein [Actinophytocola oryzae]TDV56081.1 putative ATPase [Actinophytocola oryzae]
MELSTDGRRVELGESGHRAVIAALALAHGRALTAGQLGRLLTDGHDVAACVDELERLVPGLIASTPDGFALTVPADAVDVELIRTALRDAQEHFLANRLPEAATALAEVPTRCREEPLANVPEGFDDAREQLRTLCANAWELYAAVELRAGRHEALAALLAEVPPTTTAMRAALVLATHRSGVERPPGLAGHSADPRLAQLERWAAEGNPILETADAELFAPGRTAGRHRGGAHCSLPPDVVDFTGRADVVAGLAAVVSSGRSTEPAPVCVLTGVGGAGKTTVAVHVAHLLRSRFPGGQLHLDLHGTDEDPADPADLLTRVLAALGVPWAEMPDGAVARADLFRARLVGARVLLVLDNARDAQQVLPLLPLTGDCAVLVTSRRPVRLPYAHPVPLGALSTEDGVTLLARIVGDDRVRNDPALAETVVRQCGLLPLALRIAGARLAARPRWPLAELAALLRDEQGRLDELVAGDLAVRASFEASYRQIGEPGRRAFRRWGLLPAYPVAEWAVAALTGSGADETAEVVRTLVDLRLVEVAGVVAADPSDGLRYRMHDLVRIYARQRARDEADADLDHAVRAVYGQWLARVDRAMATFIPGAEQHVYTPAPIAELKRAAAGVPTEIPDGFDYLEAEYELLTAAVVHAGERGWDEITCALADTLQDFFFSTGRRGHWRRTLQAAHDAAHKAANHRGEAYAQAGLGYVSEADGRLAEAIASFTEAARLSGAVGDHAQQALSTLDAATASRRHGDITRAWELRSRAHTLFAGLGDVLGVARADHELGNLHVDQGHFTAATQAWEKAAAGYRAVNAIAAEAKVVRRIGEARLADGDLAGAESQFQRSLELAREHHLTENEGGALCGLAEIALHRGHPEDARQLVDDALGIAENCGHASIRRMGLRLRGEVCHALGETDEALRCLRSAADLARRADVPIELAAALAALGDALAGSGDRAAAIECWSEAHGLFARVGAVPRAQLVAARLAGVAP